MVCCSGHYEKPIGKPGIAGEGGEHWNPGGPVWKSSGSHMSLMSLQRSGYLTATTAWYVTGLTLELDGSINPQAWMSAKRIETLPKIAVVPQCEAFSADFAGRRVFSLCVAPKLWHCTAGSVCRNLGRCRFQRKHGFLIFLLASNVRIEPLHLLAQVRCRRCDSRPN